MKHIIVSATLALACVLPAMGQTNTAPPEPPVLPPILEAIDWGATNWVAIPLAVVMLEPKPELGIGLAALYSVTPNFWGGFRIQRCGGMDVTAAVQGQLQVSKKLFGVTVTPFAESSVGIGKSALWGSAGVGGHVHFATWDFGKGVVLSAGGLVGWEHYVMGSRNGNELFAGPTIHVTF